MSDRWLIRREKKDEPDDSDDWEVAVLADEDGNFVGFVVTPFGGDPFLVPGDGDEDS